LKIEDLHDVWLLKNMMTALHTLDETESSQQRPQVVKTNVGVRSTAKNLEQELLAHKLDMALFEQAGPRHFALSCGAPCLLLIGASRTLDFSPGPSPAIRRRLLLT